MEAAYISSRQQKAALEEGGVILGPLQARPGKLAHSCRLVRRLCVNERSRRTISVYGTRLRHQRIG